MSPILPGAFITKSGARKSLGSVIVDIALAVSTLLTIVLIAYDITNEPSFRVRTFIGIVCIACFALIRWLFRKNKIIIAEWLIVIIFALISLATLFHWGTNTVSGILALALTIVMPGILFGSKYIAPTTIPLLAILITIEMIHDAGIYQPKAAQPSNPVDTADLLTYVLILSILSFSIWISVRRSEYALKRARKAERSLIKQKENLKLRLEQESSKLRANQLKEVQQLYSFAILGQNTTATLHELSNHLSILGMDIDGLKEEVSHSKALDETKESLSQISKMIKTIRRQFNTYDKASVFKPSSIINNSIKDMQQNIITRGVKLEINKDVSFSKKSLVIGDPLALGHILSILIKNAIEASSGFPNPKIRLHLSQTKNLLRIVVTDSGIGIPPERVKDIFSPVSSTKPSGLGVGLYIAKNLAKIQLNGSLKLTKNSPLSNKGIFLDGATFILEIPIHKKGNLNAST